VTNKGPSVVRIYLPPDANTRCQSPITAAQQDYVNVIVADKQKHLQFTTIDEAVTACTKGIAIWSRAKCPTSASRTSCWLRVVMSQRWKHSPPPQSRERSRSLQLRISIVDLSAAGVVRIRRSTPGASSTACSRRTSRSSSTSTATRG
jgi:hypothetical protein